MSEEIINTEPEVVLPSDEVAVVSTEDYVTNNTSENGKLFGRFDDVASALDHFREQEVKHTNNMRELKEGQKAEAAEKVGEEAKVEAEQNRVAKINELVPQMLQNNMQITDDMKEVMTEAGLSQAEIELGAYKVRDLTQKAFQVYGGEEQFHAVKAWADENLDDATKQAFDVNMGDMIQGKEEVGILAMEGLLARYNQSQGDVNVAPATRIQGTSSVARNVGYASQAEMFQDKRASDKNPAMRAAYQKKLSVTPDNVIYGY